MKHFCEMPAGQYYVGDLCYVMHEEWNEFCNVTIKDNECLQGKFRLKNGVEFVTFHTKWGDGEYRDRSGNRYSVDAGLIGCVKLSDIDQTNQDNQLDGGMVMEFPRDFVCFNDDGVLRFGPVEIDTVGQWDDDY
ncbi:hypothetical protein EBT31_11230 [bacterium]|jgi:hypothetical protein|nr:hypothetical protein [bacterium]NBX49345.1 hypothetical protein [bacterium]